MSSNDKRGEKIMKKSIKRDLSIKRENIKWEYDVVYELYAPHSFSLDKNLKDLKQKVNLKRAYHQC